MNFKKKLQFFLMFLLFIFPISVFAYSDKVILGGENIGIEIHEKQVHIVGFYKVNGKYIAKDAGLKIGDKIIKVNGEEVSSITSMIQAIGKTSTKDRAKLTVLRNKEELDFEITLVKDENNSYKTGIYVKDQITGIGTLTYIDPETNIFGALGHEILDSVSNQKVEIKEGNIFESSVTGVEKSSENHTGEKNAIFYSNEIFGQIEENTISGIFGKYNQIEKNKTLIEVGKPNEVTVGKASIYTVVSGNKVEEFEINILNVNLKGKIKNILFEITDSKLLEVAGGVVKGMSGSPIVQNDKIIGAVTHAIVDQSGTKGYGVFITTMLEEGEN